MTIEIEKDEPALRVLVGVKSSYERELNLQIVAEAVQRWSTGEYDQVWLDEPLHTNLVAAGPIAPVSEMASERVEHVVHGYGDLSVVGFTIVCDAYDLLSLRRACLAAGAHHDFLEFVGLPKLVARPWPAARTVPPVIETTPLPPPPVSWRPFIDPNPTVYGRSEPAAEAEIHPSAPKAKAPATAGDKTLVDVGGWQAFCLMLLAGIMGIGVGWCTSGPSTQVEMGKVYTGVQVVALKDGTCEIRLAGKAATFIPCRDAVHETKTGLELNQGRFVQERVNGVPFTRFEYSFL
ncbi:hypothetical protein KW791_02750, partial [Candidatus Parcubacteria bacterium]|nr:hypothetical protein [Candidatus Parcubacteria bacterium]